MLQVCLHVLDFMLQDVTVELKDSEDILGEGSRHEVAPVHHFTNYDPDYFRGKSVGRENSHIT